MRVATLLRAPPGFGKTTWLAHHRPRAVVCSTDHYFMKNGVYRYDSLKLSEAYNACLVKFIETLQKGEQDVCCDNSNLWISVLAPFVAVAKAYGAKVEIIRLVGVTAEAAAKRNIHGVSQASIEKMIGKVEPYPPHWPKETLVTPDWFTEQQGDHV